MDGEHLLPLLEREIDHGRNDLDASVADEHIDAAEGGDRLRHAGVDLLFANEPGHHD